MSLNGLCEKIDTLENEKTRLEQELKTLRRKAEEKTLLLECEVSVLREDSESLRRILSNY